MWDENDDGVELGSAENGVMVPVASAEPPTTSARRFEFRRIFRLERLVALAAGVVALKGFRLLLASRNNVARLPR